MKEWDRTQNRGMGRLALGVAAVTVAAWTVVGDPPPDVRDPAAGPTAPFAMQSEGSAADALEGTITIDFEDLGVPAGTQLDMHDGQCVVSAGYNYCPGPNNESGLNDLHMGNGVDFHAWNGTTQGSTHDDVELSRAAGGPFTLVQFDFAGFPMHAEAPFTVTAYPTGTTVEFIPDGIVDGADGDVDFETFTLPESFSGTSFYWQHTGTGTVAGLFSLDNIVVTEETAACFNVVSELSFCHDDGETFTYEVQGINGCTGGLQVITITASGGQPGEELCVTVLVDNEEGGFCCATPLCVEIPDCSQAAQSCPTDLDADGATGTADLLTLLSAWGENPGHPADVTGDGTVGTSDLLELLSAWGPC